MSSVFQPEILKGQVAFVTGGGTGICKGIALGLASHGADVVIVSRKMDHLAPAAQEISAATGRKVIPMVADVRRPEQIEAALKETVAQLGRLDIVVNGAAGNFLAPAAMLSYNGYRTVLEIDTMGTYNVSKAAFDTWLKDHGGVIINISATLQYTGTPMQVHACSAKAAVDAQTRTLAVEWGPLGIRVNGIAPGPIGDTEGMSRLAPGEWLEKVAASCPLRRLGRAEEIANAAIFLASGAASYVNGAILVVDGGHWLAGRGFDS